MFLPIILFAVAAVGGLFLAFLRVKEKPLPLPLALVHGGVAAAGLVSLLLVVLGGSGARHAGLALALFVGAALGGFVLFSFHLRKQKLPLPVVVVHGLVAVIAFVILLWGTFVAG